ncbi:7-cyano-7-deazaguanine synthase [Mycobacteroides abscessus]|uniref:7-cyano-7-deazaguanine synthase n=1 Tax=Mycobacteroides abscessus TaxID=36809 RepID=UPI00031BDD94|nr:7-cyano-7-deazaguanine synthase [Mycobacteroides abscessus]MDO2969869.1 7-cyano-7-deazaguanine synthase [Mycobacteroides abscessus subsp. bolletii]MDO3079870.1 7-cyano-7-deazaguanine synthase [Mycobacteroides abscessus subsp. bolletii]SKK68342.1 7-cyano-7-deazaguanine synthase [Mycobacteroides abscessus subsp. bolletii]
MSELLLLSGGLDSAAVAAMTAPDHCLFIDYGQIPAVAEQRAATQIAADLALPFDAIDVPAAHLGGGLMAGQDRAAGPAGVAAEWWPYRNQLLITIAAAWGVQRGFSTIVIGTVASDSTRHADGTTEFLTTIDTLLSLQEGGIGVRAPAAHLSAAQLIAASGASDALLGWTHSCHRANLACARCPGCLKHAQTLAQAGRLQ